MLKLALGGDIIIMNSKIINNILKNDGVIAFVTDTVWGIGCLPSSKKAVEKIYKIKHRDAKKPLILMSYDVYPMFDYLEQPITKAGQILIKKHFPGALTLVLNKSNNTPDYLTSSLQTVGIRVPDNNTFAEICKNIDGGVLATTSANVSGEPPALTYDEALSYVGDKVDYIVPSEGFEAQGLASTVAGFKDGQIVVYRQGEIRI